MHRLGFRGDLIAHLKVSPLSLWLVGLKDVDGFGWLLGPLGPCA